MEGVGSVRIFSRSEDTRNLHLFRRWRFIVIQKGCRVKAIRAERGAEVRMRWSCAKKVRNEAAETKEREQRPEVERRQR